MQQTVLVIAGSPRRGGNTDDCARYICERLERAGGYRAVAVHVRELHIKPCAGCRECMSAGECVIRDDDMAGLMEQVMDCDVLVQVAPVYWNGPPGGMKNFIDRTHGVYAKSNVLAGTPGYVVSIAADGGFEPHEAVVSSWFCHYGGELVETLRLFAREKGELMGSASQVGRLDGVVSSIRERLAGG